MDSLFLIDSWFLQCNSMSKNSKMMALLLTTLILGSSLVRSLTIDVNSFTYMESAPKTAEQDVYMEVPLLTRVGSPKISCGAHCGSAGQCVGMEICGRELCRLWNGTFKTNVTVSASSATKCHRYLKVDRSCKITMKLKLILFILIIITI